MLDLSQYRVSEPESKAADEFLPHQPQEAQKLDISQFQTQEEPSFMDNAVRNASRWGSRLLENFLGSYGDTANSIRELASGTEAPKSIFGIAIPQLADELRPGWDKQLSEGIKRSFQPKEGVLTNIPSVGSEELEAFAKTASKGYLAPQGPWEEKADEVFKNLGRLMMGRAMPGPRNPGPPPRFNQVRKFAQDLGASISSEIAKEGVKLYGGSEEAQEKAKLATLFTAGMMLQNVSGRTADNYVNGLYRQRDRMIPQGASFGTVQLENNLEDFINRRLKYGGPTPEKNSVLNVSEEFLNRIKGKGGQMSVEELLEMGRNVNRNSSSVYMQPLDKDGVNVARSLYGELNGIFNNLVEGQLGAINPQALQLHRQAQSGWGALQQSRKVQNSIKRVIKTTPFKTGVASLLGGGAVSSVMNPIGTAAALAGTATGAGVGAGILSTGQTLSRIYLSPTMRHYYSQVVMNAMRENLPAMMHSLKKLDDAYYKEVIIQKENKSKKTEG